MPRHRWLLPAFCFLLVATACGGSHVNATQTSAPGKRPPSIYAAASLTEVFPMIDSTARYNFAGSDELATQIREGAPADVYAAASSKYPQALYQEGLVEEPVTFASNVLVLIVPKDNPAGIEKVADVFPFPKGGGLAVHKPSALKRRYRRAPTRGAPTGRGRSRAGGRTR